ncbi:hypothetical protein AB4Y36_25180 [Paraburkholderia sp. BR10936]
MTETSALQPGGIALVSPLSAALGFGALREGESRRRYGTLTRPKRSRANP